MASTSLPLAVTTGLRRPPSTSTDSHRRTRPNGGGQRDEDPASNWCAWAHQGHRLWASMPDSFWVLTYKVERCPFQGNHVWVTCPYAHKGERARRRDPRSYAYVATPCPEYAASRRRLLQMAGSSAAAAPPTCTRGLRCGYAHSVFETWLHPTRFRTVMCTRGAECPRSICFFAHCLAQRRREDDEVPLVVFPTSQPFIPRAPRLLAAASASSSSSRRPRSQTLSVVVSRPVDRIAEAMQQGRTVRLLTRDASDAAAAGASSSSSSSSLAAVATPAAATTAPVVQASSSSPVVDDEDMDFVAIVTSCCLASEADSNADGSGYPHIDRLIMEIVRR